MSVDGVSGDAYDKHLRRPGVGYNGGVAISAACAAVDAVALGHGHFRCPVQAVVVRDAVVEVDASEADVATAVAVVADGDEIAVRGHGDGRNTVGDGVAGMGLEERLFDRGGADALFGQCLPGRHFLARCRKYAGKSHHTGKEKSFHISGFDVAGGGGNGVRVWGIQAWVPLWSSSIRRSRRSTASSAGMFFSTQVFPR